MRHRIEIIILAVIVAIIAFILGMAFVFPGPAPARGSLENANGAGVPNPAAAYCTSMHNRYEIRTNPDGSQYGVCILPDGTECDEWGYYQGGCPIDIENESISSPAAEFCLARNYTYTLRENPEGILDRVCVFPDGRECDAQAYYDGTCTEATAKAA
ncbi:MAG: DUF333 domain-containing protein [Methanomicrobiales archaeon]|nr:DUF333 domain-containing protein [Methanomicrobiales archaeon]